MTVIRKLKLKSRVAMALVVMLLLGMMPYNIIIQPTEVEAYGEDAEGKYYYAETWLYDYKYDQELGEYKYTRDNQHAYLDPYDNKWSESDCHALSKGNRWMTGLQVPYERLNRKISDYYSSTNVPALYLGNFYGTADDIDNRGNGDGQTPFQYTYKEGYDSNYSYADVYNNFWESANNAPKAHNGNAAVQGLVDRKLKVNADGSTVITQGNGNIELPQFSDSFINSNSEYMTKYSVGNGFPFNIVNNEDGTKTYKFDSAYDASRYYDGSNMQVGTMDANGVANWRSDKKSVTAGDYGFFPFNSTSIKTTNLKKNSSNERVNVNYGFGMKVNIPFNLSTTGTILNKYNKDVDALFTFSGDDDVWVFVDNVLVLDMGGDHAKVSGSINFNRNKNVTSGNTVEINNAGTYTSVSDNKKRISNVSQFNSTIPNMFSQAGVNFDADKFYNPDTEHVLTVYYMERGMFESNLSISFNMVAVPNNNKLKIKEVTNFDCGINSGLLDLTKKAADGDVFNYTVENSGTSAGDVINSGILSPTYDYYQRSNQNEKALLTGKKMPDTYKTSIFLDTSKAKNSSEKTWDSSGAQICAWVWNNKSDEHLVVGTKVSDGVFRFDDVSDYKNIKFLRIKSGITVTTGQKNWPGDDNVWNETSDIDMSDKYGGTYTLTSFDGKQSGTNYTEPDSIYESKNFDPTAGTKVKDTNYIWVDDMATKLTKAQDDDEIDGMTGTTDADGSFRLMYGTEANNKVSTADKESSAQFLRQFSKGSTMTVNQVNELRKAYRTDVENRPETFSYVNGRTVSEYYTTTVNVVDKEGNDIIPTTAQATSNYTYKNTDSVSASQPVDITETFVNTPRVGVITVEKKLNPSDNVQDKFKFKITLTKIFGVDGVDVTDYSTITANPVISSVGEFELKAGEKLIIEGIPYGTEYNIEEIADPDSNYKLKESSNTRKSIAEGKLENEFSTAADNNSTVTNTRLTNTLSLSKKLAGSYSQADENTQFTYNVVLKAPEGVNLTDYAITGNPSITLGQYNDGKYNFNVSVSSKQGVVISGIPYGTEYTVTEVNVPAGWTASGSPASGTIGKKAALAEITNTKSTGSITVTKSTTGAYANTAKQFNVSVTFKNAKENISDITAHISGVSGASVTADGSNTDHSVKVSFKVKNGSSVNISDIVYGTSYTITETSSDEYTTTVNESNTNTVSGTIDEKNKSFTAAFVNTAKPVLIKIVKKDGKGNLLPGAEFAIYASETDADAKTNPVVDAETNTQGTEFTFSGLEPNRVYWIVETKIPAGHFGVTEPIQVRTGAFGTTTERIVDNPIMIEMPSTGGKPFVINFAATGLFVMMLACAAMLIYKKRLQKSAIKIDVKGRYKK